MRVLRKYAPVVSAQTAFDLCRAVTGGALGLFFIAVILGRVEWIRAACFSLIKTALRFGIVGMIVLLADIWFFRAPFSLTHKKISLGLALGLGVLCALLPLLTSIAELFKRRVDERIFEEIDSLNDLPAQQKGARFEEIVARIFESMGYRAELITDLKRKGTVKPGPGDQGADVIITDRNGVRGIIQCKHYSDHLNNKPVQEIVTAKAIYGADRCFVVTNTYFKESAIEAAQANNVTLIDRSKLRELIYKANEKKQSKAAA